MKTILITGANSGIGKALAFLIARHQHRLILVVRKEHDARLLLNEIKTETQNPNIEVFVCDLSNQYEISMCCANIKQHYSTLDVLVNNAAVYTETREVSADNIEMTLAVNVLAPFLLTKYLLLLLEKSKKSEVYNISSIGEKYGNVDFNDIMSETNYLGNSVYNKSKLLLTMLTYKFSELYANKNIAFNCIHPGATMTNLVSDDDISKMPILLRLIFKLVKSFRQNPENSAKKIFEVMTKVEISGISGKFFSNGKEVKSSKQSRDKIMIDKTWEVCLKLTQK